ncbi:hypothetical protein ACFQZF_10385 [Flavobacterium myungsuense]|uniref:Uncharacterized protein n=1 Tax=Flavobacterium myungsuense TaxID=651823 RepID=A0ABW3J0R7_9FLAO
MKKQITPQNLKQIKSFWKWFEQNETQILEAFLNHTNHYEVFNHLNRKLNYVSKRIGFILIGHKSNTERIKLIMTAHGYKKLFPKVNALINNAPKSNSFNFQAFIQPETDLEKFKKGFDKPYIFRDFELKTSELYFLPLEFNTYQKKMKIVVYMKNFKYHFDNDFIDEAIQIIIQDLIGEVEYKKTISLVQLAQLPQNPKNLIHLYELQEYIDFLNKINSRVKIEI